jgi:hypothetical protein
MLKWMKKHKWLTGFLILGTIVFVVIWRKRSGSSSSASGYPNVVSQPGAQGSNAAQLQAAAIQAQADAQQKQLDAQLQAAQLQSDTAIKLKQIDADTASKSISAGTQIAGIQAGAQTQVASLQLEAVRVQTAGAVTIAQGGYARDITVAGIQKDVSFEQFRTQLAAQLDIDATKLSIEQLDTSRDVSVATINANRDVDVTRLITASQTDIAGIQANRDIQISGNQVTIADIQANVYKDFIDTSGRVSLAQIASATQVDLTQLGIISKGQDYAYNLNQQSLDIYGSLVNKINTTDFNRGGAGGANQVALAGDILGAPPSVAISAYAGQTANSPAATIGSAGGMINSLLKIF